MRAKARVRARVRVRVSTLSLAKSKTPNCSFSEPNSIFDTPLDVGFLDRMDRGLLMVG